jgi:hypothetical protein
MTETTAIEAPAAGTTLSVEGNKLIETSADGKTSTVAAVFDQNGIATLDASGALSHGIDLPATDAAQHVGDITAMIREVADHIDDVGEVSRTWLENAHSALKSAIQYVESHVADLEAKAKAEFAAIESKLGH